MFDDKPENIRPRKGRVVGVKPYHEVPEFEDVLAVVKGHPGMKRFVEWMYQGWEKFEKELRKNWLGQKETQSKYSAKYEYDHDTVSNVTVDAYGMIRHIDTLYDVPKDSSKYGKSHVYEDGDLERLKKGKHEQKKKQQTTKIGKSHIIAEPCKSRFPKRTCPRRKSFGRRRLQDRPIHRLLEECRAAGYAA